MNGQFLDFEKPILELEKKIKDMKDFAAGEKMEISSEIRAWEKKLEKLKHVIKYFETNDERSTAARKIERLVQFPIYCQDHR